MTWRLHLAGQLDTRRQDCRPEVRSRCAASTRRIVWPAGGFDGGRSR